MKRKIEIEVEIDRPFDDAEQERFMLASLEEALTETAIWHDFICNEAVAPQKFSNVKARFVG